jgi:hypothetical protein
MSAVLADFFIHHCEFRGLRDALSFLLAPPLVRAFAVMDDDCYAARFREIDLNRVDVGGIVQFHRRRQIVTLVSPGVPRNQTNPPDAFRMEQSRKLPNRSLPDWGLTTSIGDRSVIENLKSDVRSSRDRIAYVQITGVKKRTIAYVLRDVLS